MVVLEGPGARRPRPEKMIILSEAEPGAGANLILDPFAARCPHVHAMPRYACRADPLNTVRDTVPEFQRPFDCFSPAGRKGLDVEVLGIIVLGLTILLALSTLHLFLGFFLSL